MHTTRAKVTAGLGSLAASSLLVLTVPSDGAQALRRPPMPCVAIRVGVYPAGAGFCPTTAEAIDWHKPARGCTSQAAGPEQHGTPDSQPDLIADTAATAPPGRAAAGGVAGPSYRCAQGPRPGFGAP